VTSVSVKYSGDHDERKEDGADHRCCAPQEIPEGHIRFRYRRDTSGLDNVKPSADRQSPLDEFLLPTSFQELFDHGGRDRNATKHCTVYCMEDVK
jgi:hypothetical protein